MWKIKAATVTFCISLWQWLVNFRFLACTERSLLSIIIFYNKFDSFALTNILIWEWLHREVRCPTFNPLHDTAPLWFIPTIGLWSSPMERDNGRKRAREPTFTINTVMTPAPGCYHAKRFAVLYSRLCCALSFFEFELR